MNITDRARRRVPGHGALVAGLAIASALVAHAQQPATNAQRPTFRAIANLIQVDVVVVGPDGQPVRGLTKDDFEILDRTKPTEVAAFEEINHERPPEPVLPPTMTLDVADNSTARSDRLIVLILDDLHFQGKTEAVKNMARQVVEQLGLAASIALVTTSGQFGVEPTEDRALLLAQIDAFIDKFDPEGKRLAPGAKPPPVPGLPMMGIPGPSAPLAIPTPSSSPPDGASFFSDMMQYKTVEDVAKKIGMDDGRRKAFVWISGGNNLATQEPTRPDGRLPGSAPSMGPDDFGLMGQASLLDAMRKSNVAGYSIATGDFSRRLLDNVAEETGGFVIGMRNFDRDLDRLIADLDHYYLLGFYPADPKDTSYHALEVRVKQPGLTVRYRRGYQAGSVPAPPKNKSELARMSGSVLPQTELPLRLFAAPTPKMAGKDAGVDVTLEVRADRTLLAEPDGTFHDTLTYEVWAVDLNAKKVTKTVAREARLVLAPRDLGIGPDGAATYQVNTSLAIPPGRYQLRASATSAKLGKGGSVYLETVMPDFRARRLALGGISLGYTTGLARLGGAVIEDDSPAGAFKPSLDRDFSRADRIRIVCDLSNPARVPAHVTVELLDPAGQVMKAVDELALDGTLSARVDVTTALRDLTPGSYRLRLTATDGTNPVQREIGITVR